MKAPTLTHLFLAEFVHLVFTIAVYFFFIEAENLAYGALLILVMNISVLSFLGISALYYSVRSKIQSVKYAWWLVIFISLPINLFFYWFILDYNFSDIMRMRYTEPDSIIILLGWLSVPTTLILLYLKQVRSIKSK